MRPLRRTGDHGRTAARRLPLTLLLCLPVLACGGAPQRTYYTLSFPLIEDRGPETRPPLHPVRIRLRLFDVALPYDRPQMVYRQSAYEFQYDPYRLWASKPPHMLRELVEAYLRASRLVTEVTRSFGEEPPPYELRGEVLAIEELDAGDRWFGHLAMRFELVRTSDQVTIWNYHFDRKREIGRHLPSLIVRAQSEILQEEMRRIVAELDRVLSRERGVTPTLRLPEESAPGEAIEALVSPSSSDQAGQNRPEGPRAPRTPLLIVPDEEGLR